MAASPTHALDPIRADPVAFEVFRNALLFATEEMGVTLRRSAYSTNVKTRLDFSCSIFDADVRVVAQSHGLPNHLGQLARVVPAAVAKMGADQLQPGDAVLVNDPYSGGGHLNDLVLIGPVDEGGRRIGYVANQAHHVDVGGGAPASIGAFQEIYQEGVQVPPVKLMTGGQINADVFDLLLAQIRTKHETAGDLRAQIAANQTGLRRFAELVERFGRDELTRLMDALLDYTERRTRAALIELPTTTCEAIGYLDDDGFTDEPVPVHTRIELRHDSVHFDLRANGPQRRAPVNATFTQTFASCAYVVKCLIDGDIPVNEGFYRALGIDAPPGTLVHASHPAPVVGGWELSTRLTDVHFKALSQVMPDRVPAGTKGMICHIGFGGPRPDGGELYAYLETLGGGYGGRNGSDGPDVVQTHGQNTENAPIEEVELNYPVRIERYELVEDSGGPGRWRGGLGVRRDYTFPRHRPTCTILADRAKQAPWGLFGGEPGRLARYVANPDSAPTTLSSKGSFEVGAGDVVRCETCGGGGYGSPLDRDPRLVVADVHEEKVSVERARQDYGVVVAADGLTYHAERTQALRHDRRRATEGQV